ncbi:MAG: hypothetical protein PVJ57_05455 [Phycisphaerae bacterium]|jgi:hypothetical protein
MARAENKTGLMIQAGVLTWILPGLGHYRLGHRGLALTFFLAISFPYWTGLAFGGIKNSVNPWSNRWLFIAELGTGGYTTVNLFINRHLGNFPPQLLADPKYLNKVEDDAERKRLLQYISYYPESDVAQIYLATAGLLNILAILDALTRAQTGGLPTFHRELAAAREEHG